MIKLCAACILIQIFVFSCFVHETSFYNHDENIIHTKIMTLSPESDLENFPDIRTFHKKLKKLKSQERDNSQSTVAVLGGRKKSVSSRGLKSRQHRTRKRRISPLMMVMDWESIQNFVYSRLV